MTDRHAPPQADPELAVAGHSGCGPDCAGISCGPCVAQLSSPGERLAALCAAIRAETEPLVTLTHLLHLCRDEHATLWEQAGTPAARARMGDVLDALAARLPNAGNEQRLDPPVRDALAAALHSSDDLEPVLIAHGLAQLLDERYGHTFSASFRARSPYQPGVGDPIPLGGPDLRSVLEMRPTSPPWRLANRLDETRRIRLAGEWATQFRVVFDYSLFDTLTGLIGPDAIVATCHPNRVLAEFDLPADRSQPNAGVRPKNLTLQARQLDELIARACAAGAEIVMLPELCLTEELAHSLQRWVRRPDGPRLLVAGSFHHDDEHAAPDEACAGAPETPATLGRRNTAMAWVRGHDRPLTQDKHSPADRPVVEDIRPEGWPRLHVYVTADGWHLVIAICRDLLNPQAVHALSEAGANLILVPAMSETLVPFGGPAAQFVGSGQAIVAIANNPADWSTGEHIATRPARALFGHPGLGQQTRFVHSTDAEPGVALLTVRSAHISWLDTQRGPARAELADDHAPARPATTPDWVRSLQRCADQHEPRPAPPRPVTLRPAAVLVLLADTDAGPVVLLTERAPDLSHYAGQLVFPGGAADPTDDGPTATALREAAEEVGLDPHTVRVLGTLPALGLPESGFLVTPVLGWTDKLPAPGRENQAEVSAIHTLAVHDLTQLSDAAELDDQLATPAPLQTGLGRMTTDVLKLILPSLRSAAPSAAGTP